jgi:hypothetical protein
MPPLSGALGLSLVLFAGTPVGAGPGVGVVTGLDPEVRVTLRFSVQEFDPKSKEGFVECVVFNGSRQPIQVPTGYANGYDREITLVGRHANFRWDMYTVHWGAEATRRYVTLEPGRELVLFKTPLGPLLVPDKSKSIWSWEA